MIISVCKHSNCVPWTLALDHGRLHLQELLNSWTLTYLCNLCNLCDLNPWTLKLSHICVICVICVTWTLKLSHICDLCELHTDFTDSSSEHELNKSSESISFVTFVFVLSAAPIIVKILQKKKSDCFYSHLSFVSTLGFGPRTPTMSRWYSNQLSYADSFVFSRKADAKVSIIYEIA